MNRAEACVKHIDSWLAAEWGVVVGSRIRREYPITLGRIEGHGKCGKILCADYYRDSRVMGPLMPGRRSSTGPSMRAIIRTV